MSKESSWRVTVSKNMRGAGWHVTNAEDRGGSGLPDITANIPCDGTVFVELKVSTDDPASKAMIKTGRLRPSQVQWMKDAARCRTRAWILLKMERTQVVYLLPATAHAIYNRKRPLDLAHYARGSWDARKVPWEKVMRLMQEGY